MTRFIIKTLSLNQRLKDKLFGDPYSYRNSMTWFLARLGKHAYGSYLLNENPAAEGGGKRQ